MGWAKSASKTAVAYAMACFAAERESSVLNSFPSRSISTTPQNKHLYSLVPPRECLTWPQLTAASLAYPRLVDDCQLCSHYHIIDGTRRPIVGENGSRLQHVSWRTICDMSPPTCSAVPSSEWHGGSFWSTQTPAPSEQTLEVLFCCGPPSSWARRLGKESWFLTQLLAHP